MAIFATNEKEPFIRNSNATRNVTIKSLSELEQMVLQEIITNPKLQEIDCLLKQGELQDIFKERWII